MSTNLNLIQQEEPQNSQKTLKDRRTYVSPSTNSMFNYIEKMHFYLFVWKFVQINSTMCFRLHTNTKAKQREFPAEVSCCEEVKAERQDQC